MDPERARASRRVLSYFKLLDWLTKLNLRLISHATALSLRSSDGSLVEDDLQQKCLHFMKKKRDEGMAYRTISQSLMDELKVTISHSGIQKILKETRKTGHEAILRMKENKK